MNTVPAYFGTEVVPPPADLVERYAGLVKQIAYHLAARLPDSVQLGDLIQAGMIGLLESARNYDRNQGAKFETYASIRIRGAMLDEVRKQDWAPRSVHRNARSIAEAVRAVENREGRDASDNEVASELGVSVDDYHQMLQDVKGHRLLSLDAGGDEGSEESMVSYLPSPESDPLEGLEFEELRGRVSEAIRSLPERERLVMALYYDEELNLREIGAVFGVSESRVCQIHTQAIARLRGRLADIGHSAA